MSSLNPIVRWMDRQDDLAAGRVRRVPLTAAQHILHLLLTVFTGGLWAPVWLVRAARGNVTTEREDHA